MNVIQLYGSNFYFSPARKDERPSDYISMVHNKFLQKICEKSDLKGLVYHGGPEVVCQCGEWSGILHCVDYPVDHDIDYNPMCDKCNMSYNTDELLSHKVIKAHVLTLDCSMN